MKKILGAAALLTLAVNLHAAVWDTPLPAAARFATEAHVAIGGHRIWYRDTGGKGPVVVLMHARTGSSQNWDYQIPAFVAAGFRVIAWDRLGSGKSTIDPNTAPGSATDDLDGLVKHLGIDRFHLVGTAAGGFVSADYAVSYPEKLRSLTLANTLGGIQDASYVTRQQQIRPSNFSSLPQEFRELGPAYRAGNPAGTKRWMEMEHSSGSAVPLTEQQKNRTPVTFARLGELKVPVLLLTGGADLFWPEPLLRVVASHIRQVTTVVIPDVGHSAYWEQPAEFNKAVIGFLEKH